MLYYFVEFAGSFANIALLLLFIGRLFPKKEPVSKWFYVYVVLMIVGQCTLSLCYTVLLIRFWTHSRREGAFILLSEENKKSEPFSYREKVRIFIVWCG